jgi:hypothetical protein
LCEASPGRSSTAADLGGELNGTRPGAAASVREGLEETLTVLHLSVPRTLARTVRSTNCIVFCRRHFP